MGEDRYVVNQARLPVAFPTHRHEPEFWEWLGRVVATFGFLEETLGKAIFSFELTREIPESELDAAYEKWTVTIKRAVSDALGGLIDLYRKSVLGHQSATIENIDDLIGDLRKAAVLRNALCHGSWRVPDDGGRTVPFYVNKKHEIFETPIDVAFLKQVQKHVTELACAVMNTVTHMGWQFPGSAGPGREILPRT